MSIWNKILLGCIFVTALVLFVLSARALLVHRVWQEAYHKHEEAIAAAEQQAKDLVNGNADSGQMGLRRAQLELYKLLIGRGRVWDNCVPVNIAKDQDPATKQERVLVTVQTKEPVEANSVLYVFEGKPAGQGGRYLGQFTVTQVGGDQIIMRPSVRLSDTEFARVQTSQRDGTPWRLYELMPTDDHEVLAALTDEEKEAMFPNEATFGDDAEAAKKYSTFQDYVFDGKIITKGEAETKGLNGRVVLVDEAGKPIRGEDGLYTDVEDTNAKGMFIRTLRDYEVLFDEEHRIRSLMVDRIRVMERDLKFLQYALDDFRLQKQARQKEIRDLEQEKDKVSLERDSVVAHKAKLESAIASMNKAISDLIERNEATIAMVGRMQSEAARIINARTAGVVQSSKRRQATGP